MASTIDLETWIIMRVWDVQTGKKRVSEAEWDRLMRAFIELIVRMPDPDSESLADDNSPIAGQLGENG